MKPVPITPEITQTIVHKMQTYYDQSPKACCGWVRHDGRGWYSSTEVCHAPCAQWLIEYRHDHPDHFGIIYQGYGGKTMVQNADAPEALLWMEHLVDPKGPFKEVLPHLVFTDAKQIVQDRGIVIQDALKANGGLLWTFIQATRLMYEVPSQMAPFLYAIDKSPQFALLSALSIVPVIPQQMDKMWGLWPGAHCNPLGSQGCYLAHNVLNGKTVTHDRHATAGSWRCFGNSSHPPDYYAKYSKYPRPFKAWCDLFTKMKEDKSVTVSAYEP